VGDIQFHESSATAMPFPDNSFDIVFSSTMLEEGDADQMLSEMVRSTKPGGRVAVVVRSAEKDDAGQLGVRAAHPKSVSAETTARCPLRAQSMTSMSGSRAAPKASVSPFGAPA